MVHVLKSLRDEIKNVLTLAALSVDVNGAATAVKQIIRLPSGSAIDEAELPAFYIHTDGEEIGVFTNTSLRRDVRMVIYLFAKSTGDPVDQLDEMQLQIEVAMAASQNLGGLVYSLFPKSMRTFDDQGRVNFAARTLEYSCVTTVTGANPTK